MRYWAYFATKLVVAAASLYGLLALLNWSWPPAPRLLPESVTTSILHSPQLFAPAPAPSPTTGLMESETDTPKILTVPHDGGRRLTYVPPRFGSDLGFTLALLAWFLLCTGTLYLIIWDQRYRCRVCLRRLRMPIETGSWSRMLQFGRPRIEYICPYGHGTLREEELQISGLENPEWTPHSDDLWEELCASSKEPGDQS